jgi:hypothetical protein
LVSDEQEGLRCFSQTNTYAVGAHRPIRPSRAPIPAGSYRAPKAESSGRPGTNLPAKAAFHHCRITGHRTAVLLPRPLLALFATTEPWPRKGTALTPEPQYDNSSDIYRHIYRSHPSASAVTNAEGTTVFFDPDTHQVLGFQIVNFAEYYKNHQTPEGEFEIVLPARVPVNLEEEMDFDVESLTTGVRIAEFY